MSTWHEARFEPDPKKHRRECEACSRPMWLPASKVGLYKTCGGECAAALRAKITAAVKAAKPVIPPRNTLEAAIAAHDGPLPTCMRCCQPIPLRKIRDLSKKWCSWACIDARAAELKAARSRSCKSCGASFVVKKSQLDDGVGDFCSRKCWWNAGAKARMCAPEMQAFAAQRRRASIAINGTKHGSGPANHRWKGGREAYIERSREKSRARVKAYRKANPGKVREFTQRRKQRKLGRLPRGTIDQLHTMQRGKCAVCRNKLQNNFHVDHIVPLAKGGQHEATNVQLLCPPCNVRKSAKDPIDFMQERGFLL